MNAVEIEEAVSKLVEQPYDAAEFSYAFLEAFGNKAATIKRLRSTGKNTTNKSDLTGDEIVAVLQRNNIHIATCAASGPDAVVDLLNRLTDSLATAKHKVKYALATDGETVHAASLNSDEPPLVCAYENLDDHFGYFLELAGISTVRQIRENAFDIKATGRLNRLYVELLKNNPEWDGDERREDLNHFFARLIFCFFAEDTGIFHGSDLFSNTVRQMSEPSGDNTHMILAEIFRAMDVPAKDRDSAKLKTWANQFPYVNGGLFGAGNPDSPLPASGRGAGGEGPSDTVPVFTQIARSYLLHIGSLDWTRINPDIFGSMIQAVADDEERGALGMHYTSVPNILKVLNPLFLDELREQLEQAGDNTRKLLNLRKRLARIRVFDPACGSGNFLVIAYKQVREIEAEINRRRGEEKRASEIPLTNYRGIEIRHFAAEVARLALVIAEYQCDELHRGQRLALAEFLPLDNQNWITHGNALRLDWLKVCPPTGMGVKLTEDDLFQTPLEQPEIDFENAGGETYICGNPPYKGSREQTDEQKKELASLFQYRLKSWKSLDYVAGWFLKANDYAKHSDASTAFVSTNSICQGQCVPMLWPLIFNSGNEISFAHTSFSWANLASHNAGVTVVVVGLSRKPSPARTLFELTVKGKTEIKKVVNINAYLVASRNIFVGKRSTPLSRLPPVDYGNYPGDGNLLTVRPSERRELIHRRPDLAFLVRPLFGAQEFLKGLVRYCLWVDDEFLDAARNDDGIANRIEGVRKLRIASRDKSLNKLAVRPHQFRDRKVAAHWSILIPTISSERRSYLPPDLQPRTALTTNQAYAIYDAPLWNLAIVGSKTHLAWIATVCGKLKTDYRYSNTLGWNTFPVPTLSDQNKADLTRCAEDILLAREAHWPATIAELYDPEKMPEDLRVAHDRNDETLERIYIGRRFKNDTERLEKLFEMYTEMTGKEGKAS